MKRIVTVQDISCVGKCSGTVALPILSAFGIEVSLLPTAVLSTHTGFSGFTFHDLTDELPAVLAHWKQQEFCFDAYYSGYLGSIRQIRLIRNWFVSARRTGRDLLLVDPVMGDHGKLYAGFTPEFSAEMRSLCAAADLILPNLTEACSLLHLPYRDVWTRQKLEDLLKKLSELGCPQVILTGVELTEGRIGALHYDAAHDQVCCADTEKLPAQFHGTGDIFASAVLGGCMVGMRTPDAMKLAVDFVAECMSQTLNDPEHVWYGVAFEKALPWLVHRIERFVTS